MGIDPLLSALLLATHIGYVCPDWEAAGRFADIEAAEAVFEGVVQRIEEDRTAECAPDRVAFKVRRVWKGAKQSEYVLLQTAERGQEIVVDGQRVLSGCPLWIEQDWFEAGRSYIVFAARRSGQLESMGCGLSARPTTATRKRLSAWEAEQQQKGRIKR